MRTHFFYFAIPRRAPIEEREQAIAHIAATFGIEGVVQAVSVEPRFRLYRIEYAA